MSVDMHGCDAKVGSQARLAWKAKDFTSLVVGSEIGHFGPATIAGTDNRSDGGHSGTAKELALGSPHSINPPSRLGGGVR